MILDGQNDQDRSHVFVWSYSVMVITLDFESSDPGSNPGRTFFVIIIFSIVKL